MGSGLDTTMLNSLTRKHFIPTLKNQLYNQAVVMNRLLAAGRVKPATAQSLEWRVVAKKHSSRGVYEGYDLLASQPINPTAEATLQYANYYATISISKDEERKNTGSMEKLLDMLRVQMDNAKSTLKDDIGEHIYGSSSTVGGRYIITGLAAAVAAANTYAGIDRAAAGSEYWRANVDGTAHTIANLKDPTSTSFLPSIMRSSYRNAIHDHARDLIVTTKTIVNYYEDIATVGNLRFNNEVANLGFGGIEFGPGVTMVHDDYCTDNYVYFLAMQDWQFFVFPGANFDMQEEGWLVPTNQLAKVTHILFSGQLRLDSPWHQAVMSSVGAS